MNEEHTRQLLEEFPELWKYAGNLHVSLMGFGFECGNGWFPLLHKLCKNIIEALKSEGNEFREGFYVIQIKEKFGGLRYYTSYGSKEIFGLINEAEDLSLKTCEVCGVEGKLMVRGRWYKTVCPRHAEELGYREIEKIGQQGEAA